MKDEILKGFITAFSESNGYTELHEDEKFEKFANFNVISKLYPRDLNIEDLSTGGEDDIAIDGAAIIVNGTIVKTVEEIDYLRERNGTLDVVFALVQSKNSERFKGEQIGNFIFGVKSLFDEEPSMPENEDIQLIRKLKEHIYNCSIDFDEPPLLQLFFVTKGEWKEPEPIIGKVRRELRDLDGRHLFRNSAEVEFYDAERLKATYRELSRKSVKEVPFNNHVALPDMPDKLNVRQSFIGSMPVNNYIDLITNKDGNLSKWLFYDNVRDYQGKNKVNKEINETLKDMSFQSLLPLLNNGITIIAKKVDKVGSKLKLTDFQIVNGCQSSHILYKNKEDISQETHIVVKIIETNDQEVINKIIRATNRQTEVKDEAFESLKPFHKDLEEFFKAKEGELKRPIYYERRSKEYLGNPKIKPFQVVTLAGLVKSHVAIILEQPQSTHRYFGELMESNNKVLFASTKNLYQYYMSALVMNRLELLFKRRSLKKEYKQFKYHVAFLTYLILKKEFKKHDLIMPILDDIDKFRTFCIEACKIIAKTRKDSGYSNNDASRSREFTSMLKNKI
ncbi:AIPR family protein [Photobacterium sp. TY1-4]|uniref:AIPR family protein n=1 Tax=Photobacterium sp. TY1-4 TaxID=2899122 RepID=UPI0021C18F3B|nr:AIPR family protein [Photobacterium sp. TY1-4]UXI04671.1 AIPR family protein [Photobacterium sp. TY1-4]